MIDYKNNQTYFKNVLTKETLINSRNDLFVQRPENITAEVGRAKTKRAFSVCFAQTLNLCIALGSKSDYFVTIGN